MKHSVWGVNKTMRTKPCAPRVRFPLWLAMKINLFFVIQGCAWYAGNADYHPVTFLPFPCLLDRYCSEGLNDAWLPYHCVFSQCTQTPPLSAEQDALFPPFSVLLLIVLQMGGGGLECRPQLTCAPGVRSSCQYPQASVLKILNRVEGPMHNARVLQVLYHAHSNTWAASRRGDFPAAFSLVQSTVLPGAHARRLDCAGCVVILSGHRVIATA